MAQRTQIRRNVDSEVQRFIGEPGELIYNLTTKRLHTQDGATPGGHPLALLSEIGSGGGGGTEPTSIQSFRKSGDGVTSSFTIPTNVASIELTQVYITGVYQQKNSYSINNSGSSATVSFIGEAPPVGLDNIEIVVFTAISIQISQPTSTTQAVLLSGTGSQASFTLPVAVSSKNDTQVYINGIYQQKNTYDASGSNLTFLGGAPIAGTNNIEVIILGSSVIHSGISSARPTGVSVGFQFYDTTIYKPICWDGSTWRDAMGTAV